MPPAALMPSHTCASDLHALSTPVFPPPLLPPPFLELTESMLCSSLVAPPSEAAGPPVPP